jgi:hypothetical protein
MAVASIVLVVRGHLCGGLRIVRQENQKTRQFTKQEINSIQSKRKKKIKWQDSHKTTQSKTKQFQDKKKTKN